MFLQNAQVGPSWEIPIDVMTYGGCIQFFSAHIFIVCIVSEIMIVVIEAAIVGNIKGIDHLNGRRTIIDSCILCMIWTC